MERNLDQHELYVRYLLGDLPEDERVRLEEGYFADDASFARLLSAKDELIDLYARGELKGRARERFEEHFLSTPPRRRHVHEAREFIESINAVSASAATPARRGFEAAEAGLLSSLWQIFAAPFRAAPPALRYALATLLLGLALGGAWVVYERVSVGTREIAKRETEPPNPAGGPEETTARANTGQRQSNAVPDSGANDTIAGRDAIAGRDTKARANGNAAGENANPKSLARRTPSSPKDGRAAPRDKVRVPSAQPAQIASLLLTPVSVRDAAGRGNVLRLTQQTRTVRLRVAFKRGEHGSYRAVLRTVEGEEIWRSGLLTTPPNTDTLNLTLPSARLRKSDYILTLSGAGDAGSMEEINDYYFKVERPAAP